MDCVAIGGACKEDDGDITGLLVFFQHHHGSFAVYQRHFVVEQDNIGLLLGYRHERLATREFIQILIDEIDLPIIVDAGIGRPSQACEAMEMGAAAIMANTALATAGDLPLMAAAFRQAIEAGRKAYLSGLGRVLTRGASASDPLTGFLRD